MTSATVHEAIQRYANGEISAMQAASLLGDRVSVADVIVMPHQAGPPLPPPDQQKAELAHARRVLGLAERP